jgi:hypothetical protein
MCAVFYGSEQIMQHVIDAFKHNASLYEQCSNSEYKELKNMREYISKLAAMHTTNLKMDIVQRLNQQVAKYFEADNVNMSALYQELCVAREMATSEFERKEKGKYAYITV